MDSSATELWLHTASPGLTDAAALADLALGGSLRAVLGNGQRLPTVTLTLEVDPAQLAGDTSVRAWAGPVEDGLAKAHGAFMNGVDPIGQCSAMFAVPRQEVYLEPMVWDTAAATSLPETRAAESAEMIMKTACTFENDVAHLHPRAWMLNRSGTVQGAALFGLAAALPHRRVRMIAGHLQYVAAADSLSGLTATRTVTGESRRTLFLQSLVRQRDRVVAAGTFTMRKERSG